MWLSIQIFSIHSDENNVFKIVNIWSTLTEKKWDFVLSPSMLQVLYKYTCVYMYTFKNT